jgi:hypothetical protein
LNEFGLFGSPDAAWRVVPADETDHFELFAYRVAPILFDERGDRPMRVADLRVDPALEDYLSLGFDAVSRSGTTFFECSPLSCNSAATEMATNEHCLFPTLEAAMTGARRFARGNWEPGPYFVLEVLASSIA